MRKNRRILAAIVVFSTIVLAMPAADAIARQGREDGKAKKLEKAEKKQDKTDRKNAGSEAFAVDRDGHVRVIREYAHSGSLPPGLAKRRPLPPGLRNQLHERGELPPGLRKRLVPVPPPLLTRLPPVPPYDQRYFAGDDLIVVDTRTNRIVAIIRDVWR